MRIRWHQFIDGYDCKARLIPTAILLFPVFCTIYYFFPGVLSNPLQLAGGSILAFAFVYLASMFFRDRGVRYAKQFWEERGGLPSTRLARMRDSYLSAHQKNRIQLAVLQGFGIRLMSLEEEYEYPALADRKIMDAFREVKEFLRRCDGCGLVDKHGAEYGFVRNLCGFQNGFHHSGRQRNHRLRIQRQLAALVFHDGLLGQRRSAHPVVTFRLARASPNVDAECRCLCGPCLGDLLELDRRKLEETQHCRELKDRSSTRIE